MRQRRFKKKGIILVILCVALLLIGSGYAFAQKNIRLLTTETDPASVKWMNNMTAEYTKQNPDIRISLEFVGLGDMYPKLMSAVAVGDIPEIIGTDTMLTISLAYRGLLEPVTDIINKSGREDYIFPGLVTYEGEDYSVPYGIASKVIWYREDLFKQKGLSIPQTREELLECARTLTEDLDGDGRIDRYGLALALSRREPNAEWTLIQIWAGGGHVFDVWNEVVLDKAPYFSRNVETMEFVRELAKYTPPGATEYSYYELMHSLAVEKVAMSDYPGRILSVVERENPKIADKVKAMLFPGPVTTSFIFTDGWSMPKKSKYLFEAKKLVEYMVSSDVLISWAHTVPGQIIPPRRSIMLSDAYLSHPMIQRHLEANRLMNGLVRMSTNICQEYPGVVNSYGGETFKTLIFADLTQDVVIKNVPPAEAVKKAANRIRSLVEELKKKL